MMIAITNVFFILLALGCISAIRVSDTQAGGPLVFSNWPPVNHYSKPPALRQQLVFHLRTHRRVPTGAMRKRFHTMPAASHPISQQRVLRPIKMSNGPHYMSKGIMYSLYKPKPHNFHGSPPGPNTGEYIYENPFASLTMPPNKKKVSITGENKYSPLHTVPAPNLAFTVGNEQTVDPVVDNHLNEYTAPGRVLPPTNQFHQQYQLPMNIDNNNNNNNINNNNNYNVQHQYQVTEPANDQMVRDPIPMSSVEQAIYAPPVNQAISLYNMGPSYDAPNPHASANAKPIPIPLSSSLIQFSNAIPQQQLPDTYTQSLSEIPQLQGHLLQQSMMQEAPIYNPTYLVTQSNNLLNQHRERLFKPATSFLDTFNQPTVELSSNGAQPFDDVNSVASPGQILTSNQSQKKEFETTTSPAASNDFRSSVVSNTNNSPKFERFLSQKPAYRPTNDIIFGQSSGGSQVQQPILTEQEVASYLNFGSTSNNNNNNNYHIKSIDDQGFIASTYYQTQPDPQIEVENTQRQQQNDFKISQANADLHFKLQTSISPIKTSTVKHTGNALDEHQKKLALHFGSKDQLRIVVPDESNSSEKKNNLRRSDDGFATHESEDASVEAEHTTSRYHYSEDANEVTTDSDDDYFMHDTESVDRLADDGETRGPFKSSTLAIDKNYY